MREVRLVRSAAAQASTGQTDIVDTPSGCDQAIVYLNLTAVGGTTPSQDFK